MEGGKRMRVAKGIVMLSMILVAGAVDVADEISPPPSDPDSGSGNGNLHSHNKCLAKCVYKCSRNIIVPPLFAACMGLCMVGCKLSPPPAIYNCTHDCTRSNIINSNTTDVVRVSSFVNACYKGCSSDKV